MIIRRIMVAVMACSIVCAVPAPMGTYQPGYKLTANAVDVVDSGKLGDNISWQYDSDGTLTISGKGDMPRLYEHGYSDEGLIISPWDYSTQMCKDVKKIVVKKGVTSISEDAFNPMHFLESVELLDGLKTIESQAFMWCARLRNVDIPKSVTKIGKGAFSNTFLGSVTINNPDCEIYDDISTFAMLDVETWEYILGTTIYGYQGSTAEAYAKKYGFEFKEIGSEAVDTTITTTTTTTTAKPATTTTKAATAKTTTTIKETTTPKPATTATPTTTAAAGIVDSGKCGENAVWTIDSEGKMTISGEGAVSRPTEWYNAETRNKVVSLVIEEGISELGNRMFQGFENLETVSMPENILFISHYGDNAFCDTFFECPKLNFGTCGPYITWKYDEETNSLYIDGNGAIQNYYYMTAGIGSVAPWNQNRDNKIEHIYLSEDVNYIGLCAFFYCGYYEDGVSKRPEITVLNPECYVDSLLSDSVDADGNRFILVSKIYGYENSTAHKFAIENNIPFEALDKHQPETTTTNIPATQTSTTTTAKAKPVTTTTTIAVTTLPVVTENSTSAAGAAGHNTQTTAVGDINTDGVIDSSDASEMLILYAQVSTGGGDISDEIKAVADINGDGLIDSSDASLILEYYAYVSTGGTDSADVFFSKPA